ncbi:MAG: glutamate--tRNA ligase, partial [Erysipelotrichaceae bacterium]|nr:glutamate--tRNA ligase [Erysipelotrichaceae bacterium]
FGWDIPTYIHCPPVMKDEQHKLSKRNGDASFQDLVAKGYLPEAIINYIALLGWSPETDQEIYSLEELVQAFNVKRIGTSGAIFDIEKLTWMNGVYLRNMDIDSYAELVEPYIAAGVKGNYDHKEIAKILQQRVNKLADIEEMVDFFDTFVDFDNEMYRNKKMKTNPDMAKGVLEPARACLANLADWEESTIHDAMMNLVTELGIKNGQLLFPVRIAITGKAFTPGGAIEISHILGREETLRRLDIAIAKL